MQETPQQYTARMLSLVGDKDALKIQQATAKKLAVAIKGLDRKKLNKRPGSGRWAINEILAHLADQKEADGRLSFESSALQEKHPAQD